MSVFGVRPHLRLRAAHTRSARTHAHKSTMNHSIFAAAAAEHTSTEQEHQFVSHKKLQIVFMHLGHVFVFE